MPHTIHVVTPCFNAADTLDRTIHSVVTQAGRFRIRYHVQDGGSTDGSVEKLALWQRRLAGGAFPSFCEGIEFSFDSAPDEGMYDALVLGFDSLLRTGDEFVTWINADDVFMTGAFAAVHTVWEQFPREKVSWLSGAAAVMKDDRLIANYDRRLPSAAIKAGLCDGRHWPFVQQEGTFFRGWLWDAIDSRKQVRPFKLAGDWNLWRCMAERVSLAQINIPLAAFRIREQQLSASQRDRYMAEIDRIVPEPVRREGLERLARGGAVVRRRMKFNFPSDRVEMVEEDCDDQLRASCTKVFEVARLPGTTAQKVTRTLFEGDTSRRPADPQEAYVDTFRALGRLAACDQDWQFPAITEQHAFERIKALGGPPPGVVYVAFPWATLIDKLQTRAPSAGEFVALYKAFVQALPPEGVRITVCQHILMKRFLPLLKDAGIQHVFWSHATHEDVDKPTGKLRIHPFPLFPVQVADGGTAPPIDDEARRDLFSFIGARSNQYYLTQVRAWIIDELSNEPGGLIVGRDGWHYQKIVYDHQIRPGTAAAGSLVDNKASTEFQDSLRHSTFSLCPSGSGPNSIRLWESIGAGSIPVILADTYRPPGPRALWEHAAVFCDETPDAIRALPARLRALATEPGRLKAMRQGLRQLWLLYGRDSFVTDVLRLMHELAATPDAGAAPRATPLRNLSLLAAAPDNLLSEDDARLVLSQLGTQLLIDAQARHAILSETGRLRNLVERARSTLALSDTARQMFDRIASSLDDSPCSAIKRPASPPLLRPKPAIAFVGRHHHRTPLSYGPLRQGIEQALDIVSDPADADILLTGFDIDFIENAELVLRTRRARPHQKLVVMSEEPLWDLTWSRAQGRRSAALQIAGQTVPVTSLNHETSTIFRFERLPYFVLTSDDYLVRYRQLLTPSARRSARALHTFWRQTPIRSAFYLERREGAAFERRLDGLGMFGLSSYRTQLAARVKRGDILRVGKGWADTTRRQSLPDWHLDKLAALDGGVHVCSAIENVHHADYITEKIFDAFAVGAVPIYCAGPGHRIDDLIAGRPFIEIHARNLQDDTEAVDGFVADMAFCERYEAAQQQVYELVSDWGAVTEERARVTRAAVSALLEIAG